MVDDLGLELVTFGKVVHFFKEVSSTNDVLKKLAAEGAPEGTVVIAEKQVEGRGRSGKRWVSPRGGLWFSLLLRPKIRVHESFKLTFITSISIVNALEKVLRIKASIKWPNDILVNGKKVCGVLTETASIDKSIEYAVIGVGVNANFNPSSLPLEIQEIATTLTAETGKEIDTEHLLRTLLHQMEKHYGSLGIFNTILTEWRRLDCVLGEKVVVNNGVESFEGVAIDVDSQGALIVRLIDGSIKKVTSAGISLGSGLDP